MSIKRLIGISGLVLAAAAAMTGCGMTGDGNFSVVTGWNGKYIDRIDGPGMGVYVIESQYEVYGKNQVLSLKLRPKDKEGVRLDEVVVNVTFRAMQEGALNYLRTDGDLVKRQDSTYSLGGDRIRVDLEPSVQQTSDKWAAEEMFKNNEKFATDMKAEMQTDIDKKYGKGVFLIVDVKIPLVDLPEHIENKIAQIQIQKAEDAMNAARLQALDSRKVVEDKENGLLRDAIRNSGLTNEQYIAYNWQQTLLKMQSNNTVVKGKGGEASAASSAENNMMTVISINANK